MNEVRKANKPQRRWSHTSPPNQRNNPRPVGSRHHDHTSANAQKSYNSYLALAREAASGVTALRPRISISTQSISCVC